MFATLGTLAAYLDPRPARAGFLAWSASGAGAQGGECHA